MEQFNNKQTNSTFRSLIKKVNGILWQNSLVAIALLLKIYIYNVTDGDGQNRNPDLVPKLRTFPMNPFKNEHAKMRLCADDSRQVRMHFIV